MEMYKSSEWLLPILHAIAKEREFKPEKFSCFICRDVWSEPATIPCGHTFCSQCITSHWDGEDGRRRYTCPQCPQKFSPRPVLFRNTTLELDVKGLRNRVEGIVYAEPGDVVCDVCPKKKRKAAKTCMGCRISFCETHLWAHMHKEPYIRHKLVEPGINLKENVCSIHHEYITMFCYTDRQIMCPTCAARQHKGHKIISTKAEMKQRKAVMVSQMDNYEARLQHLNKEQKKVEGMVDETSGAANHEIMSRSVRFMGFIDLLQRRQSEVAQEITAQKTTVQKLQGKLEQELSELKRHQSELDSLSLTEDPEQFILKYEHLSELKDQPQTSSAEVAPGFTDITEALSDLTEKLQTCTNMGLALTQNKLLLQQPTTREQYLQYAINITLDPNTAHRRLVLSEENCRVTLANEEQDYPHHPDRFKGTEMVLSSQELTGRCYFEVQWIKPQGFLGITYKSIGRKGKGRGSVLGMSDISWAMSFHGNDASLWHDGEKLEVMNPPFERVSRLGVFLDHSAGIISFFGVCREEMFQFAKVQTIFRKPLFVALRFIGGEDSFEFLKLK